MISVCRFWLGRLGVVHFQTSQANKNLHYLV